MPRCNAVAILAYIFKERPYPVLLTTEQRRDSRPRISAHEKTRRLDVHELDARKVSVLLAAFLKPFELDARETQGHTSVSGVIKDNYTEEMRRGEMKEEEKGKRVVLTYIGLVEFQ